MLPLLADPWFLVPVDAISGLRSTVHGAPLDEAGVAAMLRRTRRGYHRVVAALASTGNDVLMDYPLSERWRLLDLLVVLDGFEVTLVDVVCAPEELDRRERRRGDRPPGLARSQDVHGHHDRDLLVDTTSTSPEDCAAAVVRGLAGLPAERAFDRLRRRFSAELAGAGPAAQH